MDIMMVQEMEQEVEVNHIPAVPLVVQVVIRNNTHLVDS